MNGSEPEVICSTATAGRSAWLDALARTVTSWDTDVLLLNPVKGAPGTRGTEQTAVAYASTIGPSYLWGRFVDTFPAEPMYFSLLAAVLRERGVRCELADGLCHGFEVDEMMAVVEAFAPKIVCVAAFHNTIADSIELARAVKAWDPSVRFVLGSAYVAPRWEEVLGERAVDYVVVGDGEQSLRDLCAALLADGEVDSIAGVARRVGGIPQLAPPVPVVNLDEIPFAARDLLPLIRQQGFGVSIYGTRGCAFGRCTFCYLVPYQEVSLQPRWRARSAENIVDEIEYLVTHHQVERVTFVDEDYFGSNSDGVERAIAIAELILARGIKINYYVNALVRSLLHVARKDQLALLARSGLDSVFAGFESASTDQLRSFRKPQRPDQYEYLIDILASHGIRLSPGLITFTPSASLADISRNVELARRMQYYDTFLFTRRLVDLGNGEGMSSGESMDKPVYHDDWLSSYRAEHDSVISSFDDASVGQLYQLMRVLCSMLTEAFQYDGPYGRELLESSRAALIGRHYEAFDVAVGWCSGSDVPTSFDDTVARASELFGSVIEVVESGAQSRIVAEWS